MNKNNAILTLFLLLQFTFWGKTKANSAIMETIVFINEIHYDNIGADTNEAIELTGTAGTILDNWSLVLYNGNGGTVYNTIDLTGTFTDQSEGYGFITFQIEGIQNGAPDGMALINDAGEVIQFLSYEGVLTAVDGPAIGLESEDIGQAETSATLETESLQLEGTGTLYTDFTWVPAATSTFGEANNNQFGNSDDGGTTVEDTIVFINEIHYDNVSADGNEAIELTGNAGSSIDGWSLVLYNGNGGAAYNTVDLTGTFTDQNDGYGFISFEIAGIQNGAPDGIALVNDVDEVIQFLSYEGSFMATDGPAIDLVSEDIGQAETTSTLDTQSLQLTGTGSVYTDFVWAAPATSTFNDINNCLLYTSPSPRDRG